MRSYSPASSFFTNTMGAPKNSLMVWGTTPRTSSSASSSATWAFRNPLNDGRSKYQLLTGRISGTVPEMVEMGSMRSAGWYWWPRSHSSA